MGDETRQQRLPTGTMAIDPGSDFEEPPATADGLGPLGNGATDGASSVRPGEANAAVFFNITVLDPNQNTTGGSISQDPASYSSSVRTNAGHGSLGMGSLASVLPDYHPFPNGSASGPAQYLPRQFAMGPSSLGHYHHYHHYQHHHHYQQQQQQQQHPFQPFAGRAVLGSTGQIVPFTSQFMPAFQLGQNPTMPLTHHPTHFPVQQGRSGPLQQMQASISGPTSFHGHPQPMTPFAFYSPPYGPFGSLQHPFQGPRGYADGALALPGSFPHQENSAPGGRGTYSLDNGNQGGASLRQAAIPSAPRGPPRKPKQSGHALWVGNLPPGAAVSDLKDHFSRDATMDIESVFLISKSNCAFVNYRTEAACAAAMNRFHDSRFQGVRLVCRLRRSPAAQPSGAGRGTPAGPSAPRSESRQGQPAVEKTPRDCEIPPKAVEASSTHVGDRYFVVKSLTVEDLELSARNGIWATQAHNEEALNRAYKAADNVFLIFSANKSGEYFGYARMASAIDDDTAKDLEWMPHSEETAKDPDLPRSIPTLATEHAPRGRIMDDSARGTIFWEADPLASEPREVLVDGEMESMGSDAAKEEGSTPGSLTSTQAFGRPFKIKWVSTVRLPFYRTRGLRNSWNANREAKIARDGTELETSIGRRLVAMFHRVPMAHQPFLPGMGTQMMYGMPPFPGRPC